ncbi:MAG: prolipoprotein diacylglyceryl transferase [Acidobacteriota bacterium]
MHPILIDFGFFQLPSYGVLLATAVVVALWTLRLRADRAGMDGTRLVDFGLWLVIWALLGAKLLLILVELPRYIRDPSSILGTIRAGGVFLGGFIAAAIAAIVLLRRYELPTLPTFDVISPSLALGHSIGRIGCLLAGCCWGASCDLPWAITYTDPVAAERLGTPLHQALHPFPLYSSLFNFGLFVFLATQYRRRPASGRVFAWYLLLYGSVRFFLELTRGDAARGYFFDGLLSTSQLISLALIVTGVGLHIWLTRHRAA